jgi:hypothetical protein
VWGECSGAWYNQKYIRTELVSVDVARPAMSASHSYLS